MKYLLDTMVWLWSVGPSRQSAPQALKSLPPRGGDLSFRGQFVGNRNQDQARQVSSARGTRPIRSQAIERTGIQSLSISQSHSLEVYDLPFTIAIPSTD